jgi:uncharacterized membrane protein YdjX (TVP38/TMEM64 family)
MSTPAPPAGTQASGTPRRRNSRKFFLKCLIAAIFIGAFGAFFAFDGPHYLALDAIKQNRDALLALTRAHYLLSLVVAFVIYTAATAFSIPSGIVLSLTLGFLFGRWVATLLIVIGGTLGATLLFLCARYLFAEPVRRRMGPFGERLNEGFTRDGFSWLLFMRLAPFFPYFLVNLVPALTDMRVRTYVAATMIGILPSTLVFTNLGQALGMIESTRDVLAPSTLIAFAALGVLALVPVMLRRWRSNPG